jgi:hypothetical protein
MTTPPQIAISDLVPLIYRARWARFGLSGDVRTMTAESGSQVWEEREEFELALDGRYRSEVVDGEGDREVQTGESAAGPVPLPSLMIDAAQLLPTFDLQITGQSEFLGRPAISVTGSPRLAARLKDGQVSGLLDAELGIFLRYQQVGMPHPASAEFTRLTVSLPQHRGREVHIASPLNSLPRPFSPGQAKPVFADDEVNLLYRSDLPPQRFTALLTEYTDTTTALRLARETAADPRRGNRTPWWWPPLDDSDIQVVDLSARLAVMMPARYLIELMTDPGRKPALITCNGQRLWRAYPDRAAVRAPEPLPEHLAVLMDPAWLLMSAVSVIGPAVVADRPALHLRAAVDSLPLHIGPLSGWPVPVDQVDVFVDRALGICLRLTSSYQGHPVMQAELADVSTDVDAGMFEFVPPPGMKVITGGLLAEWGETPASAAVHVAKGVVGLAFDLGRQWLNRNDSAPH